MNIPVADYLKGRTMLSKNELQLKYNKRKPHAGVNWKGDGYGFNQADYINAGGADLNGTRKAATNSKGF